MGMLPAPIILVCLFLVFAPVRSAVQLSNQYDNNRWFQLLILVAVALFYFVDMVTRRDQPFLVTQKKPLPKFTIIILVAFSVVSAATSSYPLWAFTELSLYLLLAVLCISVYAASREQGLQRTLRVHHPEQPSLTRVFDIGVRRELASRGDANVCAVAYLGVDIVGLKLVVEELCGNERGRERGESGKIRGARPERRASEEVLNL